ncbi:UPF0223 family protein [Sinobaca sp. H24]|uniref:UPF0223 family protein n=1 Tax=Sinobaca sp. H24 TaxID=2923376 RepID=UPI00207AC130|nr:UPF0223 family protein [Sinobaca sp. H24]
MEESVNIPISMDWSTEEVVDVVEFFTIIEKAYDKGVKKEVLLDHYNRFKKVVPSKSEEKTLCGEFEGKTKVSCWHTVQAARKAESAALIKMN